MIKFLKKFKEKILIALACSFIGIGTLFINTIETKAYVTNEFTHTITNVYLNNSAKNLESFTINSNNSTIHIVSSVPIYSDYVLLVNVAYSGINTINTTYKLGTSGSVSCPIYTNNNTTNYTMVCDFSKSTFSSDFGLYDCYVSSLISGIVINNIDVVNKNDLTLSYYYETYIQNLTNQLTQLQSQYDSLLLDYQNYQNTHAYTNEQYSSLMNQNAILTQQVQTLQSQYDTYISLHSYSNEQYETLLTNYNNLQNMYSNLQSSYLVLQQQYESLALSVAPFTSSKWNNRTGSLNGVTYDMQSEYRDSLVSFEKTYLFIYPRDSDVFDSFSDDTNTFVLTAYCDQTVTLSAFNVIANLSHLREESFQIDFYLDNSLVYSTIDFDNDMGENDSNTLSVDRFLQFNQITITVVFTGVDSTIYGPGSYFNAVVGSWQDGYDYAVGQLMPQINRLENELQQSISQQQVKYNEGYNQGVSDSNSQPLYGMVIRIL